MCLIVMNIPVGYYVHYSHEITVGYYVSYSHEHTGRLLCVL